MIELLLVAEQLLDDGAFDRAELLFTQVAQADPRNAIAVAGLARVALARGDRDRAFDEARRALAIDPEEAAAQRLIVELIASAEARDEGAGPDQDLDPVQPATWSLDPAVAKEARVQEAAEARARTQTEADHASVQAEAEAAAETEADHASVQVEAEARAQAAAAAEARAQAWALAQAGATEARARAIANAHVAAAEARAEATAVVQAAAVAQAAAASRQVTPEPAGAAPERRSLLARLLGMFGIRR